MVTHIIKSGASQFSTSEAGSTWLLKAGSTLDTQDMVGIEQDYAGTTLVINGKVSGYAYGIVNKGADSHITVGGQAEVLGGGLGVQLYGDNDALDIRGEVASGAQYTVLADSGTHTITSSGYIFGDNNNASVAFVGETPALLSHGKFENSGFVSGHGGVLLDNSDATVINEADGLIKSLYRSVTVFNTTGVSSHFRNAGEISAGTAFLGGDGDEHIVNSGKITGDIETHAGSDSIVLKAGSSIVGNVSLGDGDDFLDLRHGAAGNASFGGDGGDDRYVVDKDGINIVEAKGGGIDSVKSSVTFHLGSNFEYLDLAGHDDIDGFGSGGDNWLYGNSGNNHLSGGKGSDVLYGLAGKDRLTGGAGDDFFVFGKGNGHDTITDFHQGNDRINLHYVGAIGSLADIQSHAKQDGADVVLDFGGGDVLTIAHIDLASLKDADFLY